jgi:hypothetical protein
VINKALLKKLVDRHLLLPDLAESDATNIYVSTTRTQTDL